MRNYINGIYGKKLTYVCFNDRHLPGGIFERFESYSGSLKKEDRLGLQFVPGEEGINLFVVTDNKTSLNHEDLGWVFNGYATVRKGAPVRANFTNSKREIFVLAKGKYFSKESYDYFDSDYVKDLFAEMKKAGARMQILTGIDEDYNGCIFLSVPGKMSTKLKAIIKITFKFLEAVPFSDKCKADYALPEYCVDRYVSSLLSKANDAKKAEPGPENNADNDDDDDDDDLFPFDIDDSPDSIFDGIPEEIVDDDGEDEFSNRDAKKDTPAQKNLKLEELGFTVRTYNSLKRAGINDLKTLQSKGIAYLSKLRNLGPKGVAEIKETIAKYQTVAENASEESTAKVSHMEELDSLIGLENVKEQVRKIAAYARMKKAMGAQGTGKLSMALNTEFSGNPGTAKTTVARILAGIFHEIGLLESDDIVEVGRSDLIAGYVGQTAPKVRDVFKKADGKLLFIDEAYSLVDVSKNDFGDEAIDTIVQEMENRRDRTIVIFAGYPDRMAEFFERNPGLRSRVPFSVKFSDYPVETLVKIAESEASKRGFAITADAVSKVNSICAEATSQPQFGNGRFCRNLVENAILNFASRNFGSESATAMPEAMDLIPDDFAMPTLPEKAKPAKKFGFV
jgi:SpoVK/Ycf46/Vps4 family AAA+-type ATPase